MDKVCTRRPHLVVKTYAVIASVTLTLEPGIPSKNTMKNGKDKADRCWSTPRAKILLMRYKIPSCYH